MVHEVVLRPQRVAARVQQHPAVSFNIETCAAGDGQRGVGAVIKVRPLDGDVASAQEDRPEALDASYDGCAQLDAEHFVA